MRNIFKWLNIACLVTLTVCALLLGALATRDWISYWRSRSWRAVDGNVLSLDAQQYAHAQGQPLTAHVCELHCEYAYQYDGKRRTGNRVNMDSGSSDASSRAQSYVLLKEAQENDRPVTVWVNPKDSRQATLFREKINSDMSFGVAIPAFWFGGLAVIAYRRHGRV